MLHFSPAGTPCDPNDVVCTDSNGVAHLDPKLREFAHQVSTKFNISPYLGLAGVAASLFALKWWLTHKKNPTQTPWESLMTLINNEFGIYAAPIQEKLNVVQQALSGEFRAEVIAEQPFLNQDGKIFADMVQAGVQSKLNQILPSLVTLMLTPENKQAIEQNAQQASSVVSSTDADAGTAELAQATAREHLENVLRELCDRAKTMLGSTFDATVCPPTAEQDVQRTADGRAVYVQKDGSLLMNFRDAHRLGSGTIAPAVMVPVDSNHKPVKP